MKIVLLLLLVVLVNAKETIEIYTLPSLNHTSRDAGRLNIGYLGTGYHIIKGNPWNLENGLDPGWRLPLINYYYTQNLITTDGKWLYPDGTVLQNINDCTYQATAQQTYGVQTYYNKLSAYVSVSGGGITGSFSASAGYTNTKSTTSSQRTVYVATVATCNAYRASLYPFETYSYSLSSQFMSAVDALPATYSSSSNAAQFKSFFDSWGTHVTTQINMGSRAATESTFSDTKYGEMITSNVDVSAAAKVSWGVYSGSISGSSSSDTATTNYFNSIRSDVNRIYLGAPPPLTGDWSAWYANVINSPYPLAYSLRPIHTLLPASYAGKATAISSALNDLCSNTPGCVPITNENVDPTHTPTTYTCRFCTSCGGNYPVERGRKQNQYDYSTWDTFGAGCNMGSYSETWTEAALCCAGDTNDVSSGMCRYCASCGGNWPADGGARENNGDYGPYQMFGTSCTGGYNFANVYTNPHLCCNVGTQCRLCSDQCGGAFPTEVGRTNHNGDWGSWDMYGFQCSDSRGSSWSVPVYCCGK